MADVFDRIFGQPQVRDFLRSSVRGQRVTHAYLFTGPAGSNKTQAAFALAAALLCQNGGCDACEVCGRIGRRKHPDVRYYRPEGANGYLVEQVREIIADAELAPIQESRKVYILDRIELMGASAANAFLKTLEEPPDDVVIILMGRTRESVLPTIVSRCIVVPFRHIPASEAAGILSQRTGADGALAKIAIESCGGSITRAMEFLKSNERLAFRSQVLDGLGRVASLDSWDVIQLARDWAVLAKAPLDAVRASQEQELAQHEDLLDKAAIRQIEKRHKRELTAKSLESFNQILAITSSFLRDVLAVCAGTPQLVINYDVREKIADIAAATDEARVTRALEAVRRCAEAVSYNVSPETCLDAMIFEIGEALNGTDSPR